MHPLSPLSFVQVGPGLAHLSNTPFSPLGFWGRAWRSNREFVGRIGYGAVFRLWHPEPAVHATFPSAFRRLARQLVTLKPNQPGCPISFLSSDVLFYILNMCRYDWCSWHCSP